MKSTKKFEKMFLVVTQLSCTAALNFYVLEYTVVCVNGNTLIQLNKEESSNKTDVDWMKW